MTARDVLLLRAAASLCRHVPPKLRAAHLAPELERIAVELEAALQAHEEEA